MYTPANSCAEIKSVRREVSSGVYWTSDANGVPRLTYCQYNTCICTHVLYLGCVTGYQVIKVIRISQKPIRSNSNLALLGKID